MKADLQRVVLFSAFAQAAGFAKSVAIAFYFGIGAELDGYYLAQVLPVTAVAMIQSAVRAGLFPVYVRMTAAGDHQQAARLAGCVVAWLAIGGLAVSSALAAAAPALIQLTAPRASADTVAAATTALRVLAFLFALNLLADVFATLLNAHMRFASAALAPAANAIVATAILVAAPEFGLQNLIWGTLIGLMTQIAICAAAARAASVRVVLTLRAPPSFREAFRTGIGMLPGTVLTNLSNAVPQLWAAQLGSGALSVFAYASRLHSAVTQVLIISVSTVLLPHFARQLAEGQRDQIAGQLRRGFPVAVALSLAVAGWVWLAAEPALRLLYERGAFQATATKQVAMVWFVLSIGLLPMLWGTALSKVTLAAGRTSLLSMISGLGLATLLIASAIAQPLGVIGVAAAVAVRYLVTSLAHQNVSARVLELVRQPDQTNWQGWATAGGVVATLVGLQAALTLLPAWSDIALVLAVSAVLAAVLIPVVRPRTGATGT